MRQRSRSSNGNEKAPQSLRATSYDVARLAGVSQSAVSRCFSLSASISPLTRSKVERAARELGYSPNALARSLITRRSGLIGLVVTTATLRYSPQIVHDLGDALQKAGLMPLLTTLADENDLTQSLPGILNYRPEAIISLATVAPALIRDASARGVPFVLVNRAAPKGQATSIQCDQALGVRQLVERLLASGHRRLAFVAGPRAAPVSQQRRQGFDQALKAARISQTATVHADYTYEGGHDAALKLVAQHPRLEAIVCANDAMALGVLDACRSELGIDVPGQISVTGFDDIPESCRPTRLLTTIRQPTERMASLAVAEILRLGREPGPPQSSHHLIPGTVMMRNSARLGSCE